MIKSIVEMATEWAGFHQWCKENGKKTYNGSSVSEYIKLKGQ